MTKDGYMCGQSKGGSGSGTVSRGELCRLGGTRMPGGAGARGVSWPCARGALGGTTWRRGNVRVSVTVAMAMRCHCTPSENDDGGEASGGRRTP